MDQAGLKYEVDLRLGTGQSAGQSAGQSDLRLGTGQSADREVLVVFN